MSFKRFKVGDLVGLKGRTKLEKAIREHYENQINIPTGGNLPKDIHPIVKRMPSYKSASSLNKKVVIERQVTSAVYESHEKEIFAPKLAEPYRQGLSDDDAFDQIKPAAASMLNGGKCCNGKRLESVCSNIFNDEGLRFEPQPKLPGLKKGQSVDALFPRSRVLLEVTTLLRERFNKAMRKLEGAEKILGGEWGKYLLVGDKEDKLSVKHLADISEAGMILVTCRDDVLEKFSHHKNLISIDEFVARARKAKK
jgi:hypothetical protein